MAYLIRPKRASSATWSSTNPVLANGEQGVVDDPGGELDGLVKFGDGVTAWNSLPYAGAGYFTDLANSSGQISSEQISDIMSYVDSRIALYNSGGGGDPDPDPPDGGGTGGGAVGNPFNFNYQDGDPWPTGWTTGETNAAGIQDIRNYHGRLVAPSVNATESYATYTELAESDFEITGKMYRDDLTGTSPAVAFRGNAGFTDRWELVFQTSSNAVALQRYGSAGFVQDYQDQIDYGAAGTVINWKIRAIGATIQAWVWSGTGTPPTTPTVEFVGTATAYQTSKWWRLKIYTADGALSEAQRSVEFDDLTLQTFVPAVPPTGGGGGGGDGSGTGDFTTLGADVVAPDGRRFVSVGLNMTHGNPVSGSWINNTHWKGITGRAAYYKGIGANFMRIGFTDNDGAVSYANVLSGALSAADECIAEGIACTIVTWLHQPGSGAYTYNEMRGAGGGFNGTAIDAMIARYKPGGTYNGVNRYEANQVGTHAAGGSPYFWMNPFDEPWGNINQKGNWATVGTEYYNDVRSKGFTSTVTWQLPNWSQAVDYVELGTVIETFLSGKTGVLIGWHPFSKGSYQDRDRWSQIARNKGIPLNIGGFGAHWDPNVSDSYTVDGIPMGAARIGARWSFDKCYTYGWGVQWWSGIGMSHMALRLGDFTALHDASPGLSEWGTKFLNVCTNKPIMPVLIP